MKILFIIENGLQESLAVSSLAAAVQARGHQSDAILFSHTPDLQKYMSETRPDIVGFSLMTGSHSFAYDLGRDIRSSTDIPVVAGGPHATYYPEHMAASGSFDFICRGEGEAPLATLMDNLQSGRDAARIEGLWALVDGVWHKNGIGDLAPDLDLLPIPDRSVFYKYDFLRNMSLKRFVTGVGCPYPCTFCHSPIYKREMQGKGRLCRHKSPAYVIREIKSVQRAARLDNIHFSDDTFGHDVRWLEEFVPCYKREIGLPFSCNARADTPHRVVELLKDAGCTGVQIGLESGSARIRKELLKKMWSDEEAVEVCHRFKKAGMKVLVTNMVALPSETLDEAWSTVELSVRCDVDYARNNVFLAHPALDLTKWAQENGYIDKNYSLDDFSAEALSPIVKTPYRDEFINIANLFSLAVHCRPLRKFIRRHLISRKPNRLYDFIGSFNLLQDYLFLRLKFWPSLMYFNNTLKSPIGFKYGAWPTDKVSKHQKARRSHFASELE